MHTRSFSSLTARIPTPPIISRPTGPDVIPGYYGLTDEPPPPDRQQTIRPVSAADRSSNPLRPLTFNEMIGQETLKPLLRRIVEGARISGRPLDHVLLAGSSGTGKTTIAHVLANELGRPVYQVDAPVSHDLLCELGRVMNDGDILFVDEIHQQVAGDRRAANK